MSLLKELALLPVAPLRVTVWVAQQVADEADRKHRGAPARVQQLQRIDEARRRGELDEDEAATREGQVLEAAVIEDDPAGPSVIGGDEENESDG